MASTDSAFSEVADRFFKSKCPRTLVRSILAGAPSEHLWNEIEEAGLLDVLRPSDVPEDGRTGAAFQIAEQCGAHLVPVPVVETLVARAIISDEELVAAAGPVCIAEGRYTQSGDLTCECSFPGRNARHVLVSNGVGPWCLIETGSASRSDSVDSSGSTFRWSGDVLRTLGETTVRMSTSVDARSLRAVISAALIAGASRTVLEQSLVYANDRHQFGRSIGKFQAVQHQLAVMAEHVAAAQMSAQLAWDTPELGSDRLRVAIAKARCSEAAVAVAGAAHAVHGAFGYTEDCDLQLATHRLREWRVTAGSESYWHGVAGRILIEQADGIVLDALRRATDRPLVVSSRPGELAPCPF